MVFADGFLFPVKELGFWTNPGHWVRVLDAAGSYMSYCIVNNVTQCMNIIYAGFPGLGFQVKNLCVMFVFAIVSFLFFSEYQFAVDIVQG
jgi:hypothetical protein